MVASALFVLCGLGVALPACAVGPYLDDMTWTEVRVALRAGCARTLETCASRYDNAIPGRGEPFLPGNDLITRTPTPSQ